MHYIDDDNEENWHDYLLNIGYKSVTLENIYSSHLNKNVDCIYPADHFHLVMSELQRCFRFAPQMFTKHMFELNEGTDSQCKVCGCDLREEIHLRGDLNGNIF